ncbi:hypothetical protein [Yoonia sediminilitoris]|uniref:Uncharacterized protein n=1 Tax=Yoonia sediminilitoris TaxID=1286148 RepID=A0A2T6KF28_9RHOB|nr:hypothetical protein [Yoonia sediminilitoris]PUB13707.1 hypothetical protein C8N45_107168 [Yoonia sediminilitoris]RCW94877.1 hypothetical protein DFP92_107168 [Yoonia sediminilitoris]
MTNEKNIPELVAQVAAYSRKPRLDQKARERLLAKFGDDEVECEPVAKGTVVPLRPHLVKALPVPPSTVAAESAMAASSDDAISEATSNPSSEATDRDAKLRPLRFDLSFLDGLQVNFLADFSADNVFAEIIQADESKVHFDEQKLQSEIVEISGHQLVLDLFNEPMNLYQVRDTSITEIFAILHKATKNE